LNFSEPFLGGNEVNLQRSPATSSNENFDGDYSGLNFIGWRSLVHSVENAADGGL
jgi:hypothetical protein